MEGVGDRDAVVDGLALKDEVEDEEAVALTDAVLVVDGEHDAHTVSVVAVHELASAQGQVVHGMHAEAPGRLA